MGGEHLLACVSGVVAGCGLSFVFPGTQDDPFLWADASVLPVWRRRGIGEQILRRISGRARELGKHGLELEVRADDQQSIHFVEARGFREVEREEEVELDLAALAAPPAVDPPAGVEIVSYAERRDLERGMYEVDREASADIPGLASAIHQTFEEWRSFAIERPGRDPELTFLALADDRVVGIAALERGGDRYFHQLTGVRREWRGRGVASALKRAQIAAAHGRGATVLVTGSQHENLPMRNLNLKLGYRPTVANIVYRGPLLRDSL